ncbi:MAG TPA: HD domain-containing phosphohydrolase [Longimicrobiales bacterium]|nr:HD domain-containing phosphohydrolase [Longimicrobiales bacterium]
MGLRARLDAGDAAKQGGRPAKGLEHFEAALHALPDAPEPGLATKLLRWIAWAHAELGDAPAALDCLEAAEAAAIADDDPRALASVLNIRAGTLFNLGELDDAESLFQRVRDLGLEIGDRKLQAMADQNLGSVASIRGDGELALGRFQSSLAHYEFIRAHAYVGPLLNNIGRLQLELGALVEAERTLERARATCGEEGDRHHLVIVEVNRARVFLRTGRVDAAVRTSERALRLAEESGDERWLADIHLTRGQVRLEIGLHEEALGCLDSAGTLARGREDPKLMADVALAQARGLKLTGNNQETLQKLNEARRLFEHLRARRDLADVGARLDELEAEFLRIVTAWGESIESKDAYTQGHCTRVARYAGMLAEAAGISGDQLHWFRMGALLHDVGKVAVPLEILNKKGKLDDEEWAVMSGHPEYGVELLEGIDFPWDIRPMVQHHHERFDGMGYPDRLQGTQIPLEARILTVADIYDALTTTRSYRAAFSHREALHVLEEERGGAVDPQLLDIFLEKIAPAIMSDGAQVQTEHRAPRREAGTSATRPRRVPAPEGTTSMAEVA